ncbi:hypothetical protein GCM10010273_31130 [Streptomyces lavendulocolor]
MAVDLSFHKSPISEDDARDRITRCGDPEQLRRWLARAVTAASVEDVFVEP